MIYTQLVKLAIHIAFYAHHDQYDKSGLPYITHSLHIAELMDTEDECVVALLHDVLEDTEITEKDLQQWGITNRQIEALKLLRHIESEPYLEYVQKLRVDPIAIKVKIADLRHNADLTRLAEVTEEDRKRMEKYKEALQLLNADILIPTARNNKQTYNVDMVFCIDATGSMSGLIEMVKRNAINFYYDFSKAMETKGKMINSMRIRLIVFRDYKVDGEDAMLATDFISLPNDADKFIKHVNGITAFGGEDDQRDGLEALAYAIRSSWDTEGKRHRQVIVVWTNAGTHDLGFGASVANYPSKMAKDFSELTNWWGDKQNNGFMDPNAKRLLLFAPNEAYWNTISDNWDNVLHYASIAGQGLAEYDYLNILEAIVCAM